jgi:hypothetical protein
MNLTGCRRRLWLRALGLGLVAALAVAAVRHFAPPPAPVAIEAAPPPAPTPATAAAIAAAPAGDHADQQPAVIGRMLFPDGSTAPALNGVAATVTMQWDGDFAPITGRFTDRGWEWYRHADGSCSTVQMVEMNGVLQPLGVVARPGVAQPPLLPK